MDSTQIFFSMQVDIAEFTDSAVLSMPAPELDSGASIFLAADKTSCGVCSIFFTLHASLESAMFRVREGFEDIVISVKTVFRKFFGKIRSMWRGRMIPSKFPRIAKHTSVLVMRT